MTAKIDITPSPYLVAATNRAENLLAQLMHRLSKLPQDAERSIGDALVKYVSCLADREQEVVRCNVDQSFALTLAALSQAGLDLYVIPEGSPDAAVNVHGALVVTQNADNKIVGIEVRPFLAEPARLVAMSGGKREKTTDDN